MFYYMHIIIMSLTSHQRYEYNIMYYICGQSQWWYDKFNYNTMD